MTRLELTRRFESAWTKLQEVGQGARTMDEGNSYIDAKPIISEEGKTELVWIITQEIPYVPGSLQPGLRAVDLLLPSGKRKSVSSMSICFPVNFDNASKTLDIIEQIRFQK